MFKALLLLSFLFLASSFSFKRFPTVRSSVLSMADKVTIVEGVEFDTIAREWRLKWSADNDKKSLASVQQILYVFTQALKRIDGVKSVQRVVCGGCLDFKVIVALPIDKFKAWESEKFSPESDFLAAVDSIPGISNVETQTYTLMPVDLA